ncbi:MAG: sigma-54 dependent transcriptional regulator [Syntrophorhabdus sp.]
MTLGKILVVDDEKNLLELIEMGLEYAGYEVATATNEADALRHVREQAIDIAILDLQLEQSDGITLMEKIHMMNPGMPVIILTGYGSIATAVDAMKRGAYGYHTKPFDSEVLLFEIGKIMENRRMSTEIKRLKGLLESKYSFSNIIAQSKAMQDILETISRIANTDSTVLLLGESGTGKDLIAKAIHVASDRKDRAFVAINCAALPEPLLESNLFGHEKGAFSGAIREAKGLFLQAHGGTIFLDEIADMPLSVQAKMLRVIQEKQVRPVGSEKVIDVDVRIITATNKNLEDLVRQELFREDLYYRIHVIPIHLPPLRERKEDIPLLVDFFVKKTASGMKKMIKGVTPQAMQKLMLYDWPGNIRELENTIEYAVAMTDREFITEDVVLQTKGVVSQDPVKPLREAKDAFEKSYLIHLMETCRGNITEVAKYAGKYRADLYDLLKKHNLSPDNFKKRQSV